MHIIHTLNTSATPFLRCCVLFFVFCLKLDEGKYSSPGVSRMDEWTSSTEIRRYRYANVVTNRSQNKNDQHQQDSSFVGKQRGWTLQFDLHGLAKALYGLFSDGPADRPELMPAAFDVNICFSLLRSGRFSQAAASKSSFSVPIKDTWGRYRVPIWLQPK